MRCAAKRGVFNYDPDENDLLRRGAILMGRKPGDMANVSDSSSGDEDAIAGVGNGVKRSRRSVREPIRDPLTRGTFDETKVFRDNDDDHFYYGGDNNGDGVDGMGCWNRAEDNMSDFVSSILPL
jgi:hypothetical protein